MKSPNVASPGRRLGAWLLDALIGGAIIATPLNLVLGGDSGAAPLSATIIATVLAFAYLIAFDGGQRGATPGKRIVGTRVVDADTGRGPIGYGRAVIRRLGYVVGWAALLVGWLWLIWDRRHQAWHDKFANTLVVRTR